MHVKETSIDVDNLVVSNKDDIGLTRQVGFVKAVSIPHSMNHRSDNELG